MLSENIEVVMNIKKVISLFFIFLPMSGYAEMNLKAHLFGFNYMLPESAKCIAIEDFDAAFETCHWQKGNGYDGESVSYSCLVSEFEAFIFFKDKTECNDQLETMLSNVP